MTAAGLAATGLPAPPPYGVRTLAEVVPSLLSAVGAAGFANPLAIPPARSACLLLVDGLGWELLREHADAAPFLTELAAGTSPISAGFPATTAVSLTSLGTGRPAGEHGIVGYTFAVPDLGVLNALTWRTHGAADPVDLREAFPPEEAQPWPTLLERAAAGGPSVSVAAPAYQAGSGLTRTAFRGGRFQPVYALGDLAAALTGAGTTALWYGYHGDLDTLGHRYGPGSRQWRMQLAQVDALVRTIATNLPAGGLLAVTADHGMVPVPESEQVDADSEPALRAGVRLLGGEVRARHVYARAGRRGRGPRRMAQHARRARVGPRPGRGDRRRLVRPDRHRRRARADRRRRRGAARHLRGRTPDRRAGGVLAARPPRFPDQRGAAGAPAAGPRVTAQPAAGSG